MNKALDFFDKDKMVALLEREVLPLYPLFREIKNVDIIGHKKNIWDKSYHVVFEFKTLFIDNDGGEHYLPIFCTAHYSEPRQNVYDSLKFLWDAGFNQGNLTIPRPLFFSEYYNGTFYRGVEGRNLYKYIRESKFDKIEEIVPKAAAWFAKLHGIPAEHARNFNLENSRIATVFPGIPHILERIAHDYPQCAEDYRKIYRIVDEEEKKFLNGTAHRWLIHGDAHPENVIRMGPDKIGVIDFTDLCLSDFARDLGAFTQQLEFMCRRKIADPEYAIKIKQLFLDNYFANARIDMGEGLEARINNYYYWTAIRTATFFLIKSEAEPERAFPIIVMVKKGLNIK